MIFADLVAGESVFLDANTFIYHFAPDPILGPACSQLLQRIDQQDIVGYTSTHILSEVAHRLMTLKRAIHSLGPLLASLIGSSVTPHRFSS
jgi:predicted nucleic acid-binding protein